MFDKRMTIWWQYWWRSLILFNPTSYSFNGSSDRSFELSKYIFRYLDYHKIYYRIEYQILALTYIRKNCTELRKVMYYKNNGIFRNYIKLIGIFAIYLYKSQISFLK